MNTEQQLTEYIMRTYAPAAIVLHGSCANGMWKEHSDWDMLIFTHHDVAPLKQELVCNANLELTQIILPIPEDKFLGFFFRTENTKILYDPESIAKRYIELSDAIIKKGNHYTQADRTKRHAFLSSALDGIGDYKDDPLYLFDKKIDFYTKIVESWFRFKKNEYEPSHYYAFPIIKQEDPEFYACVHAFVEYTAADDLIVVGKKIIELLFPDIG